MRTVIVAALVLGVVLVLLGLILEALAWLIAVGLVLLVIGLIAGWFVMRRARGGREGHNRVR